MATIFTVIGTPDWANGGKGWNRAPTKTADLQAFVTAAARRYSGTFKGPDGAIVGRVSKWIAWNEPNNPVFLKPQFVRSGSKWVIQSAKDYAQDVQRRRQGGEDRALHQSGRLWRHLAEGQQPARDRAGVGVPARLHARDEARRRDGLRRLRAPPVLRVSLGDAEHEAAARQARPAPDGRHARQLRDADEGAPAALRQHAHLGDRVRLPDESAGQDLRRHPAQAGPLHAAGVGQAQGEPEGRHDDLVPPARSRHRG